MTKYINIREYDLYPLPRMRNGYSVVSSAVGIDEITDVESGNQPLSHMGSGNLNNQEGNGLDNRKPFLETYSDRGLALGGVAPALKEGEG